MVSAAAHASARDNQRSLAYLKVVLRVPVAIIYNHLKKNRV
jgi:hypothetical protein